MPTVKESLIAAKALIDTPEKWGKGLGRYSPENCFCAISALSEAIPYNAEDESFLASDRALCAALPDAWKGQRVYAFNDHPDTTHADIMALFDRAIAAQDGAA